MAWSPGSHIGTYEIVNLLGAGGMGEVYRAHDSHLGRDVALKTLPAALAADPERVARFEREARILATLNHPNIATLYGFEKQAGLLALVMELVEGETLHEHLLRSGATGRGLPVSEVVAIARQIVDALDAAHEKGVVHRDLKPANVKLTPDGLVKVLDFGLAKAIVAESGSHQTETRTLSPAETRPNAVMGTAAYMSPEQARGLPLDRRTDVWAFGCVLYEMLSGQPAFARSTSSDTIAAVLTSEIDWTVLPARTPTALRQLLGRCLERTTKARLRDIADARSYLDEAASPSAISASGVHPPAEPAPRAGVSRRALFASSAALGLVGAGLGATLAAPRRDPPALPSFQRLTFRRGMIRTARFAPDSQTVIYGALWDGDSARVYTVRADSPESSPLSLAAAVPLAVSSGGELALALGPHLRGIMTYGTLARVPLAGGAPREVQEQVKFADWTADGRELAIIRRDGARDVLEFPAGRVIAEPAAPAGFSFVRVSPRGDAVAAFTLGSASTLGGRVVIYDRSGAKRAESAEYFNVFGLAWRGDEVWFTAADEVPLLRNAVFAMDASGGTRVVARVPGNASLHDIAPDGRVLLARTDDRGGMSVRVPGESTERDLAWFDAPNIVDMSKDGRRVLFWEGGVGGGPKLSVFLRGSDGTPAVRLGDGMASAISPDGQWVIARSGGPHLDLLPVGAGSVRRIERPGLELQHARWLPDSRRVLALARQGQAPQRLYLLDVDGTSTTPITPESLSVTYFGWRISPDGAAVAVSRPDGVELFPVAGGASRRVPSGAGRLQVVGWIESGLLVSEDSLQSPLVYRMDPATGRRELWMDFRPADPAGLMNLSLFGLVTTPDGRGYGYTWHRATSDLYLVRGWS
jgi:hypothetical protein